MIKILKYKNNKAAFHECRASKKLLNDIFKFPEGLCLPCLTRKAVPQCRAAAIFPFVNGRCHLKQSLPFLKQSLPFITVVAISVHASSDKNAGVHENR